MTSIPELDDLRRFLFLLPRKSNFQFTKETRKQIRKELFCTLSKRTKYINWIFPNLERSIGTNDKLTVLDKELDWSFSKYFKRVLKSRGDTNSHDDRAYHVNLACARIFRKGEPIYRCLTCGYDDTCALCSHCFREEYHVGHKVNINICQRENGGVCDCGDPEAWVRDFVCPYTKYLHNNDDVSMENDGSDGVADGDSLLKSEMPKELQKLLLGVMEILLDYVIDVMTSNDLHFYDFNSTNISTITKYSFYGELDGEKYDTRGMRDVSDGKFALMVYNDQVRHYRDAVQRIRLASKKVKAFATMVTDRLQSYGKAKVLVTENLELLRERQKILSATGLATCIRCLRDVFREEMVDEIVRWICSFTESELFKSNVTTKDLLCQAFCKRWKKGLAQPERIALSTEYIYRTGTLDLKYNIPKIQTTTKESLRKDDHWYHQVERWNLPEKLCQTSEYNTDTTDLQPNTCHLGSRFQYFIYFDIRFWKSIRTVLHDMYSCSVITNLNFKNVLCAQYVDIYPTVADMLLTKDREPETNVMGVLSTQIFTCPSNSTLIVQHHDLSRIFASIYSFLTEERIRTLDDITITHKISIWSLKIRRWCQCFFDVSYILTRSNDFKSIVEYNIIPMACDIIALFQGRPVIIREGKTHVEYESPDYTAFFQNVPVIYLFAENIAHCFSTMKNINKHEQKVLCKNAIMYVVTFLLKLESNNYPGLLDDTIDIDLKVQRNAKRDPRSNELIQEYRIDKEKVSFLHPLHSLLAFLIQFAEFESSFEVKQIIDDTINKMGQTNIPNPTVSIFDYSVRTIVLMSQIKSGFWVRNGFSVRSQLQLYRNTNLRECGYMRDLFLIQVFVNTYEPDFVCNLLFDRWQLLEGWTLKSGGFPIDQNEDAIFPYDHHTLSYILDECLNFFIQLQSEVLYLRGLKENNLNETHIRNELIHNLCFGPMTYSKLCSNIPEHVSMEKRFDLMLQDVSTFSAPTGANDVGMYKLKDEFINEVNPYYFNYTANMKDDVLKLLKHRIMKKTNKTMNKIVIEPNLRNAEELGIYRHIGNYSLSSYFSDFIIKTLLYIVDQGVDKSDNLLETTLHLIHICALERYINTDDDNNTGKTFFANFTRQSDIHGTTIAQLLFNMLDGEAMKDHRAKIRSIFAIFDTKYSNVNNMLLGCISQFDSIKLTDKTNEGDPQKAISRKKRIAKDRQARLMAKFKEQQSLFLKQNQNEIEETSDVEMVEYGDDEGWQFPEPHCLYCQNALDNAGPFGIITYVSKSSEFRKVPFDDPYWFMKAFSDSHNLDNDETTKEEAEDETYSEKWKQYMKWIRESNVMGPGFSSHKHVESKVVSQSCGHGMHFQCYVNFLNTNRNKQQQISRNVPESIEHREFLCPLCKAINNMFIPILWVPNKKSLENFVLPLEATATVNVFEQLGNQDLHEPKWLEKFGSLATKDLEELSQLTATASNMIGQNSKEITTSDQKSFRSMLTNMFQILTLLVFPRVFKADSTLILTNTIKSTEISLRGLGSISCVIDQISNNALLNLRAINEFRNNVLLMKMKNWLSTPAAKADVYMKLLTGLSQLSNKQLPLQVQSADFFEILVNVIPLPSLGFLFNAIFKACFVGHILQVLSILVTKLNTSNSRTDNEHYGLRDIPSMMNSNNGIYTVEVFRRLSEAHGLDHVNADIGAILYTMLIKSVTPFLRRAAILAYVNCADIESLPVFESSQRLEADRLCDILKVPSVAQMLQEFIQPEGDNCYNGTIFNSYVQHLKSRQTVNSNANAMQLELKYELEYPGIVKLIDLPDRLDYFFTNYYYLDRYNNPHTRMENPAICLYCAEVMDVQRTSIGEQEGQCTIHYLKECAGCVGLFLLPKDRTILILTRNGGSFHAAPYLDKHGELPSEMKKSKPLYLMRPRYNDFLRNVWLLHNVVNYVARKLDSVVDAGGWDTL
ncbi:uncharacterized protein KQ657_001738 [Scheffersomyces spartinae]|uniref:E3 ubiquitin-protein ligase n=1 Tax=Scheffersomyces spartinae TaxID=45513 RepID=A0A9P8AGG9_9ASCO|nr:uncharacterized protein KQ657_001738 [Scheffersomyces spartinae]KAG7192340.1 hypothetical protein KQ657_001738 [Scheffersomyces spartinae]